MSQLPATIGLLAYCCTSKTEHPWNQQRTAAYFSSATFFSRRSVVREIQAQIKSNKIRELAVTVSAVNCQKENKTKLFHMVFILIKCFVFFHLLSQRHSECWLIWYWRTQYDFTISHAICKTAKKWRLHFAEKMFLPKQNNLLLSIFCVSFARHYLTIFSLWKRKDF